MKDEKPKVHTNVDQESAALAKAAPSEVSQLDAMFGGQAPGMESGFEDMSSKDFVMPLLKLLQTSSPEVKPTNAKYKPEAKVGQFLDTSTGELMDSVEVIPCLFQARQVEWTVDDKGQPEQFVAVHDANFGMSLPSDDRGRKVVAKDRRLVDTRYHYVLRLRGNELIPNIISLYSSGIKISKEWNSKMDGLRIEPTDVEGKVIPGRDKFRPPMFMHVCRITSTDEHKGKNDWKGWKIDLVRLLGRKEADILMKAQQQRGIFQETSKNMKPPVEAEPEYVPPDPNENKHI